MEEQEETLISIDSTPPEVDTSSGQLNNLSQPKPFDTSLFDQPSQQTETIDLIGADPPSAGVQDSTGEVTEEKDAEEFVKESSEPTKATDPKESQMQNQFTDENLTNVIIDTQSEVEEINLDSDSVVEKTSPSDRGDQEIDNSELKLTAKNNLNTEELLEGSTPLPEIVDELAKDTPDRRPVNVPKLPSVTTFHKGNTPWDDEDPFLSAISNSEADRRQDAWLPSESTLNVLQSRVNLQGTDYASRPDLTMPGISFDEAQVDTLKELLYKYHIEDDVTKRKKLTLDQVTRDLDGLKRLLNDGCLRSAVQLTGLLLTSVGQGKGQSGMPSQNTAESIQIWFTRLALLVKLRQFSTAELESQPFRDFDKPDLYYQYYPALYPGRKGSMVPFSFRVLVAEIPQFVSQHQQSMTRLYALLATCQKIVSNLSQGWTNMERKSGVSEEYIKASLILWKNRVTEFSILSGTASYYEVSVLNSVTFSFHLRDYYQSIKVFQSLSKTDSLNWCQIESLVGRIYLQLGDLKSAQETFTGIEKMSEADDQSAKIQVLINKGFLRMAQNMYTDAHIQFSEVIKLDPGNFTCLGIIIFLNHHGDYPTRKLSTISVCLLYMGKLKSALNLLESLVNDEPTSTWTNLSSLTLTLYELESSKSANKKQQLLGMAAKRKGDGFNVSCLKLP
ncbi:putative trafficking protein particle complex subunit 12 [Apostichopus japonicus]|uniref:Putative trafficking protein particle complex subunit 12 n=1 Tax=Stichopus japonicus TaxID=307972 RepID=A0A2G8KMH8_STIJA|nr:putative trafficking protein particle complex subunit 12 [Apostichopus japonicus]